MQTFSQNLNEDDSSVSNYLLDSPLISHADTPSATTANIEDVSQPSHIHLPLEYTIDGRLKRSKADGWCETHAAEFGTIIRIMGPYLGHTANNRGLDLTRRMLRRRLNTDLAKLILQHSSDVTLLEQIAELLAPVARQKHERQIRLLRKELEVTYKMPWDSSYTLIKRAREKEGMARASVEELKRHILSRWRPKRGTLELQCGIRRGEIQK